MIDSSRNSTAVRNAVMSLSSVTMALMRLFEMISKNSKLFVVRLSTFQTFIKNRNDKVIMMTNLKRFLFFGFVFLILFSAANAVNLDDSLAYWAMDLSTGQFNDSSVNNNHLTNGSSTSEIGILNEALGFDGISDYVDHSNLGEFQVVNLWIYPQMNTTLQGIIGQRFQATEQSGNWQLLLTDSGKIQFITYTAFTSLISNGNIPANQWTMVTAVTDGVNKYLYINGVLDNSQAFTTKMGGGANTEELTIGRTGANEVWLYFNGTIDEVALYTNNLSSTNISQLYNNGSAFNPYALPTPELIIDNISLVDSTITNDTSLNVILDLITVSTNSNVNTTLNLGNGSTYQIGTNTLNVNYTLYNISEGNYNISTFSFNNQTNVSSSIYAYTFDYTAPNITVIGNLTQTQFQVNFSNIFNVTDTLSDVASCKINITYLMNVTNASQYNDLINCTDTHTFQAVGNYNWFVTATDNAGNAATLSVNGTIHPLVYVQFYNTDLASLVSNYNATIYRPDNTTTPATFTNSTTLEISAFNSTSDTILSGNYQIEFSKLGYVTSNFTIPLNETSGELTYTFNLSITNIIVNIYDRTTGNVLSGTSVTVNILGLANQTTTTGQVIFQNYSFAIGNYSVQAISTGYGTEQKDFYYSGQANATVNLYLLLESLNTTSTLYVPVTDEFDNVLANADVRLLEYDVSIFGFKEVSQCYTDSNGECRFLVEVGIKTYIVTGQKVINGILYTDQSSADGETFQPEISGGEEILGRDIIRALKLKITDTIVTPDFYGLTISAPANENATIVSENSTSTVIEVPVSFTATDNLAYTVCVEVYRFTNSTISSVISPICTTGSSGILPTSPITLNNDYNYQVWITAESGNNDVVVYRKYYYYSNTSFFATMVEKHYVNPMVMFFWSILLAFAIYLRSISTWVYGAWGLSVLQLAIFPGYLFASATVTIILINAGVLYMSKRQGDTT
jgi:hypothetical protein